MDRLPDTFIHSMLLVPNEMSNDGFESYRTGSPKDEYLAWIAGLSGQWAVVLRDVFEHEPVVLCVLRECFLTR